MKQTETEAQLTRYLLDELEADDVSVVEERLGCDPAFVELICSVEDELIVRFVRGDLGGRQGARFQEVYMESAERRARVESARVLYQAAHQEAASRQERVSASSKPKTGRMIFAYAAAAAIVLFAAGLLVWRSVPTNEIVFKPDSDNRQISAVLEPDEARSTGGGTKIELSTDTRQVRLQLMVPAAATGQRFRATLETPEQPNVWSGEVVRKGDIAVATVPAEVMLTGDYKLRLRIATPEAEEIALYFFRVVR